MKTRFYNFHQEKARGGYKIDRNMDMVISIEAPSKEYAIARFKDIIEGENDSCEHCGPRFTESPTTGPTMYPEFYGKRFEPIESSTEETDVTGVIYYMDDIDCRPPHGVVSMSAFSI